MNNTDLIASVVSRYDSRTLQHVRRTIEAEQIAAIELQAGRMTQANVGQLEMLEAVGAELARRGHLAPFAPWVEVSSEDGARLSRSIRVF